MHPPHPIACVSFLNSKPLIEPLLSDPRVAVEFAVPADLLSLITSNRAAAALLPIVDYQTSPVPLLLVPAGGIGCDGPTLTVRIFSQVPPHRITRLYADTDSHTSVILAQLILRERFSASPEIVPFKAHEGQPSTLPTTLKPARSSSRRDQAGPVEPAPPSPTETEPHEAMLLIGDKVVNASPPQHEYLFQLDLGEQWKILTSLPFVFAMWMIRRDYPPARAADLAQLLAQAQRQGATMTDSLLDRYAAQKLWPRDLARQYFTEYLHYAITAAARQGVAKFFELAAHHHLLPAPREVTYLEP